MTNAEFADTLEKLAAKYRENGALSVFPLMLYVLDKTSLQSALKSFGGKWKKEESSPEDSYLTFASVSYPPLEVYIPRAMVCRRIVTYECDPIMSPEEEAEVLA